MSEAMNGEQLTLLPAASLASLSVWPGNMLAQQMTVTSGQKLLEYSRLCGRPGSVLRTLLASSAWRSTMCLLTWKHKVTPQGRSYYRLRVSVPRTGGTGSGLWPTATQGSAVERTTRYAQGGTPLTLAVQNAMLPTPNAAKAGNDVTLMCSGDGRQTPNKLGWAVAQRMWESASDHKGSSQPGQRKRQLSEVVAGYKLNPDWVGRMMGFPDGWLAGVRYVPPRVRTQPASISLFSDGAHYIVRSSGTERALPIRRVFRMPHRTRVGRATP